METNRQSSTNTYASVSCNDSEERTRIVDASTKDGTMDIYGKQAMKGKTGGWRSGMLLLVIEGLAATRGACIHWSGSEYGSILKVRIEAVECRCSKHI